MAKSLLVLFIAGTLGCSGGEAERDAGNSADTVTQTQRDSAVARSGLPGARGVSRAQDVSRAAQDRAAALDSIQ